MSTLFRIDSISQLHRAMGLTAPDHPLVTMVDSSAMRPQLPLAGIQVVASFYTISFKQGRECSLRYGRREYDFQAGSLGFLAPEQVFAAGDDSSSKDAQGWILCFHPDLLRTSALAEKMHEYSFFAYSTSEALHLSDAEKQTITALALGIRHEYTGTLDEHSHELIISQLHLLLNYCKRFYGRQFITRGHIGKGTVARLETYLREYFDSARPQQEGLPTVKQCARQLGYSPNYLSDLLKKETGKTTQEHIHGFLVERAKNLLLGTDDSVNGIAYALGFEYPQHFSKLFKNKTGLAPAKFRH